MSVLDFDFLSIPCRASPIWHIVALFHVFIPSHQPLINSIRPNCTSKTNWSSPNDSWASCWGHLDRAKVDVNVLKLITWVLAWSLFLLFFAGFYQHSQAWFDMFLTQYICHRVGGLPPLRFWPMLILTTGRHVFDNILTNWTQYEWWITTRVHQCHSLWIADTHYVEWGAVFRTKHNQIKE